MQEANDLLSAEVDLAYEPQLCEHDVYAAREGSDLAGLRAAIVSSHLDALLEVRGKRLGGADGCACT